jgi:hypothetical protein
MNKFSELFEIFVRSHSNGPKLLGWNLPAEDMHLLIPHWQSFEAPPFYYHLLLALIYFVLMVISTVGNGIVVWIFST